MEDRAHAVPVESLLSHRGWVRALAWSLVRDAHLVDEVEQETWLRAMRSPPREESAARGWLGVVVRNVVRNRFRSRIRREAHEGAAASSMVSPATADVVARADSQQTVVRIVMGLDEPYRTTLLLRFFDDLPPRDVAARMGVPVETVRTRTKRALARVRDALTDERGGRRAAFALLMPLLAERLPPLAIAGASGAAASSVATTTGAVAMAVTAKKVLAAGIVLALVAWAGWMAMREPAPERVGVRVATVDDDAAEPAAANTDEPARRRVHVAGEGAPDAPEPASEVDAAPPETRCRVLLPDGTPVRVLSVASVLNANAERRMVGTEGGVVVVEGTGIARLSLVVPGRPVHEARVELTGGEVDVVLPEGEVVEGIVRVNGLPPREAIALRLSGDGPGSSTLLIRTEPDGSFRFAGLTGATQVRMVLEEKRHHFVGGDALPMLADPPSGPFLDVPVPSRGLVLDLIELPRLSGRVVTADGDPAVGVRVAIGWRTSSNDGSMSRELDDDGVFDIPLPSTTFESLKLTAWSAGGISSVTAAAKTKPVVRGDLGDLVLPATRRVELEVVDTAGRPIESAAALVGRVARQVGRDGRVTVEVAGDRPVVSVGALGYQYAERELPPGVAEPVRLTLEPALTVVLDVEPEVHEARGLTLRISSGGTPMFIGRHDPYTSGVDRVAGASSPAGYESIDLPDGSEAVTVWYAVGKERRVVLNGVHPDAAIDAVLLDALGVLHDRLTVRPAQGSAARHVLHVRESPRTVAGVVRDPEGRPVDRARVVVAAVASQASSEPGRRATEVAWTGSDGRFEVHGVFADAVDVLVTAEPGVTPRALEGTGALVPWSRAGVAIESAADLDVRMVEGVNLSVVLKDARGAPVAADFAFLDIELPYDAGSWLWSLDAIDEKQGRYMLLGVPNDAGTMVLEVHVTDEEGDAIHRIDFDPSGGGERTVTLGEPTFREHAEAE